MLLFVTKRYEKRITESQDGRNFGCITNETRNKMPHKVNM